MGGGPLACRSELAMFASSSSHNTVLHECCVQGGCYRAAMVHCSDFCLISVIDPDAQLVGMGRALRPEYPFPSFFPSYLKYPAAAVMTRRDVYVMLLRHAYVYVTYIGQCNQITLSWSQLLTAFWATHNWNEIFKNEQMHADGPFKLCSRDLKLVR